MQHDEPTPDELAWLAFRYVAGELTAPECEQFELVLAASQEAREAVASAVELSQAVVMASGQLVEHYADAQRAEMTSAKVARWAIWATGVAACVALAVGVVQWSQQISPDASGQTAALAARWSEVRTELQADYPWHEDADDSADAASDWALSVDELVARDAEQLATPEWMLAAVLEQHEVDDMRGDMPGDIERGGDESQDQ